MAALWRTKLLPINEAVKKIAQPLPGIQSKVLICNSFQSMLLFFHSFLVLGIIITKHTSRKEGFTRLWAALEEEGIKPSVCTPAQQTHNWNLIFFKSHLVKIR